MVSWCELQQITRFTLVDGGFIFAIYLLNGFVNMLIPGVAHSSL